jgi:DNA (cytosine-5)-methyltransferase 1
VRVLDLFSGIGGLSLGLAWAGMRTVAFCERDPWCRSILARHWPGVPLYDDVRKLTAARLHADGVPPPELVCGGFPCQDVSAAGRGGGLGGARSGLWREMQRLVAELRPGWVVAENSPALRVRGADEACAGLEALGYACWPLVVGAAHAGAPHRRERVFVIARGNAAGVVAHAAGSRLAEREREPAVPAPRLPTSGRGGWPAPPPVRRVADGISGGVDRRVDRVRALGNAVVPAVAEMVGRAVLHAAGREARS